MAGIERVPYKLTCPECGREGKVVIAEDENLEGSVRSRSREGAASAYNATSLNPD